MTNPRESALSEILSRASEAARESNAAISEILQAARRYLGMDIGFISQFAGSRRFFRYVDATATSCPIKVGESMAMQDGFCLAVVEGRLPMLIHDAAANPVSALIPATHELPIGAHVSVPLHLSDGRLYGTFCCFSPKPDQSLNPRDIEFVQALADLAARQIERSMSADTAREQALFRIGQALEHQDMRMVYQPIHHLIRNKVIGYEALARFNGSQRPPNEWFDEAAQVGLGAELELLAVRKALEVIQDVPDPCYLAINISPPTLLSPLFETALLTQPLNRLVLEVTEHFHIDDYEAIRTALAPLRNGGLRLAVDDAGAGYSSLRHILNLSPDIVKLDITFTHHIDRDPARRAMASALVRFSSETGCELVAEGVETESELQTIRDLGILKAQGFHLGRPAAMADLLLKH